MATSNFKPSTFHLSLPFFGDAHSKLMERLLPWIETQVVDESDDRAACLEWVKLLGKGDWLRFCVPAHAGGVLERLDSRALVLIREALAFHSPLADFAFAMQGLGSGAITLAGRPEQHKDYLVPVGTGEKIAAFALSEPDAGSDVGAMTMRAVGTPEGWRLNGEKTWISNGGLADFYCVFAKTDPAGGTSGITAFIIDASTPGLDSSNHIQTMSPHPLSSLRFDNCLVPDGAQLGELNGGFKLAMRTLDIFRASVAGAALGMARRALAESIVHARSRRMFGQTLANFQLTQAKFGEMAALIDSAALLTYRAAWMRDVGERKGAPPSGDLTAAAAMAKMCATENASRVIDMALQMHGGLGVKVGSKIEGLYRDIRALRIYEGATEVQQLIIGKAVLASKWK